MNPDVRDHLLRLTSLDPETVDAILEEEGSLAELLVRKGGLPEDTVLKVLGSLWGLTVVPEPESTVARTDLSEISLPFLKKHHIAPLAVQDTTLHVAVSDPESLTAAEDLGHLLHCRDIRVVLSPQREVLKVIHGLMHQDEESTRQLIEDLGEESEESRILQELGQVEDLLDSTSEAPVIRLVNMIFTQAVKNRASDVHIEPYQADTQVRYRIDGVLYEYLTVQRRLHASIVSRIKVLADLNIAEKRLPQDGRIQIKMGDRDIDIRVSIIPTMFGERVVLRLLDKQSGFMKLQDLGFSPDAYESFERLIRKAHGIILVTGPTGSGKTTTLYGALSRINSRDKNIITVEDPIEYQLNGVGQIQVAPKIGLTFASGLRSILRHDPDVIMIGEIRDIETAEISIQASLTGHLVFSTLHTNDSAGAMTRLTDMGLEPFLITSSVLGVMAQRLVRTICPKCRTVDEPSPELLGELGIEERGVQLYRGAGCDHCFNSGYRGRTSINEILVMDGDIRRLVLRSADASEIKEAAVSKGMVTLRGDGIRKALAGFTTVEEVLRVTQD